MSLRIRRIIYIAFIIAFLVITPLVCLYAVGYRINLSGFKGRGFIIQKTGMLILNSQPRGADIDFLEYPRQFLPELSTLNKNKEKTPAKIKNLLPGDYKIRLELEGYWPWEKKLTIWQGETTFAEDIYLFKNNLPLQIFNEKIQSLAPSSDKRYVVASTTKDVFIFDINNDKKIFSAPAASSSALINPKALFNHNNTKLIINNTLFDLGRPLKNDNLKKLSLASSSKIKWSASDENLLYYSSGNTIYGFNLSGQESKPVLINSKIADYLIKGDKIYTIIATGQASSLNVYNALDKSLTLSLKLPYSPDYRFINENHKLINLYDSEYRFLYLINPANSINPLMDTISNIKLTKWIDDNRLLYSNGFEVWLYYLESGGKTLLTRISDEIINLYWHSSNNYVVYITNNTVNTIELDEREKRNITELLKLDTIKWPFISNNGKAIYFYTEIGNFSGIYKLSL